MKQSEKRIKLSIWSSIGLLVTMFMTGCGNDSGPAQPGVLGASLTDAPACGYDEVNVTVSKLRVHQSGSANETGGGWTEITLDPARKINLLSLNDPTQPNFALESLGQAPLPAGHYTQLRLVLDRNNGNSPPYANSIVLSGQTSEIPLETSSGIQSGIKLIHQFDVGSGQRVDLLLDFDACKSIVKRSNDTYALKPVTKVIPFVLNGIEGFVDASLLGQNVVISAQVNGEIVRATVPNAYTGTPNLLGKFLLARLNSSVTYDVVVTADGHAAAIIAGVPVPSSTSITTISTRQAPINLQTSTAQTVSGTVTLDPANDDGSVFIAAKQTLNPGPTVTVKSQTGIVLMGDPIGTYSYSLTVPIGAPSLGQYSTTLPIIPTAASQTSVQGVAGMYAVHGSAQTASTLYTTQSPLPSPVDATGGATQNFTLRP